MKQQDITKKLFRAAAALCCAFFPLACAQEEAWTGAQENTQVQIAVDTRANEEGTENAELALHSLRVYAFIDNKLAGHYFSEETQGESHTFNMDITRFKKGTLSVNFYLVANEAAMTTEGTGAPEPLSEKTTEDQLNQYWFTDIKRERLGLPMFCKEAITLDPENVKLLSFSLKRPMGKLEVFAAKLRGETEPLKITGISLKENGTRARNYLMPQSKETLEGILGISGGITLTHKDEPVTAEVDETEDKTKATYQSVMIPHYPYENPWGSNTWNAQGTEDTEGKGHVMDITYQFGEDAERTGTVYLPPIERNGYIRVNCLMKNEGKIEVNLTVADWNVVDQGEQEFDYPTYVNPITPSGATTVPEEGKQFPQPTIYFNHDKNDEKRYYTFDFTMTGPAGQHWKPVLYGTAVDDYTVEVLQKGEIVNHDDPDVGYDVSPDPYQIRILANSQENENKEVSLGISYISPLTGESQLLMINGRSGDLKWENSEYPELIRILQIPTPSTSSN